MITFIIGKRTPVFEKTLTKVVGSADIERVNVTPENIYSVFDEIQTPSLFGGKKAFIVSGILELDETKELLFERGASLRDAPHDIVIIHETLLAADVKKAEKLGIVQKITDKEPKESAFNPFVLGNAFETGDKKQTWIAFSRVVENSSEIEPTHGLIWWKLKDMMVKRSVFAQNQMIKMARNLVAVYHDSRLGGLGMRERLEKFFLTMPDAKK